MGRGADSEITYWERWSQSLINDVFANIFINDILRPAWQSIQESTHSQLTCLFADYICFLASATKTLSVQCSSWSLSRVVDSIYCLNYPIRCRGYRGEQEERSSSTNSAAQSTDCNKNKDSGNHRKRKTNMSRANCAGEDFKKREPHERRMSEGCGWINWRKKINEKGVEWMAEGER